MYCPLNPDSKIRGHINEKTKYGEMKNLKDYLFRAIKNRF